MSKRSIVLMVVAVVIAGVTWEVGRALWGVVLAMHGGR
jgi:hypothetical protein